MNPASPRAAAMARYRCSRQVRAVNVVRRNARSPDPAGSSGVVASERPGAGSAGRAAMGVMVLDSRPARQWWHLPNAGFGWLDPRKLAITPCAGAGDGAETRREGL